MLHEILHDFESRQERIYGGSALRAVMRGLSEVYDTYVRRWEYGS